MNAPTKLGAFAVALGAAFLAAAGVGQAVGPLGWADSDAAQAVHDMPAVEHAAVPGHGTAEEAGHGPEEGPGHGTAGAAGAPGIEVPGGLQVSQDGYTLDLAASTLRGGTAVPLAFRILDGDGAPVTAYERTHDKDLHLIAVRRDLSGFQHVHPALDDDGTWTVPLSLTPGQWRVFADFQPAGADDGTTLGADLAVGGEYDPRPLAAPSAVSTVDGYTVTLAGELIAGAESELTLSVSRDGEPVTDLEPYLAAYGHLVALRDGDLAYLHVHPAGSPDDGVTASGPAVTFYAEVPSVGTYGLFLDFMHDGVVRTAAFTAEAVTS